MKKLFSVFLAAVMLLSVLSVFACAEGTENYNPTLITASMQAERIKITYHTGVDSPESYERSALSNGNFRVDSSPNSGRITREGYAFAGWAESVDGAVKYRGGEVIESDIPLDLYAVWCPTYLESDEVFSFSNASYYFTVDEKSTYYLKKENLDTLQKNIFKVFGSSPVPGVVLSAVLGNYPTWEWKGSCYGMSTVTALQHYGLIDVKPIQNADKLIYMTNDENLISYINYYQANAATSWLCENKAVTPGTAEYAESMEDMFESVKSGNIVLYTFYTGKAFVTPGHTVLLTGAYEDVLGNHLFVAYDCNHPYNYTSGKKTDRFVLSPDFKHMTDNEGGSVGAANWTDRFTQFEAFSIDGNGKASSWYSAFFAQIGSSFIRALNAIGRAFKA